MKRLGKVMIEKIRYGSGEDDVLLAMVVYGTKKELDEFVAKLESRGKAVVVLEILDKTLGDYFINDGEREFIWRVEEVEEYGVR